MYLLKVLLLVVQKAHKLIVFIYSSPYFALEITIQNASYSQTYSPYDPLKRA